MHGARLIAKHELICSVRSHEMRYHSLHTHLGKYNQHAYL